MSALFSASPTLQTCSPGAVLGTGDPGSRPGRHFFIRRGGRQEHFKKKIILAAKRFSIIHHITVCGIGKLAPPAAAGAPDRLEGTDPVCEWEGEGARGTVHLWVSQMELVRLEFSSAKVIN